jgi:hypothetical protein
MRCAELLISPSKCSVMFWSNCPDKVSCFDRGMREDTGCVPFCLLTSVDTLDWCSILIDEGTRRDNYIIWAVSVGPISLAFFLFLYAFLVWS